MKIKTYKVFAYDELTDKAKEKALTNLYDINVNHEWWNWTYEDAARVGLIITAFDLDRAQYVEGNFKASAEETAHLIEKEHGKDCETYKTAKDYLRRRDAIIDGAPKDENGDFADEYKLDRALDQLDAEFLKDLCEDYRVILTHEYEYLTSKEAIEETIHANEYEFTEDGKID